MSGEILESLPCPYCGLSSQHYLSASDINRRLSNESYNLFRCSGCDLFFVANPPKDLSRYYHVDYHFIPKSREELDRNLVGQKSKIDILLPYKSSGSLLEIGPSVGYFCALAQKAGFEVSAIEMDSDCVEFLRSHLGVKTMLSADPASILEQDSAQYDAVCMWHSLEHMPEPWRVFEMVAKRLRPDGVFLIAAPNPLSVQAALMGKYWPHHDLPRHLFGMPIKWLEALAKDNGLVTVLSTTRDKESIYWNRFSWAMKIKGCARWLPQKLRNLIWMISIKFAIIFSPWEDTEGNGACYVMIFQNKKSF